MLLGAAGAVVGTMPARVTVLLGLAVCGLLGLLVWRLMNWPVAPVLRALLLACFAFRAEVNLFLVQKYNEAVPGLSISLMLLVSLMLLARRYGERGPRQEREPVFPLAFSLAALTMLVWCTVSVLGSKEQRLGFYALWGMAVTLLMCYVTAQEFGSVEALAGAVKVLAVAVGLSGLIGTLQVTTGLFADWTFLGAVKEEARQALDEGEVLRAYGFVGGANSYAWYLVSLMPLLFSVFLLRVGGFTGWKRAALAICAGAAVLGLVLSFARGSWIMFGLSWLLLPPLAYRAAERSERPALARRCAALLGLAVVCATPLAPKIYLRLTEDDRGSAYSRVPLMQVAEAMIADNPWLGVGPGNYEAEMRRYDETPMSITDTFDWPVHNVLMYMTAEGGLPSILCFFTLLAVALWNGRRAMRSRDPFLRAVAVGLCVGVFCFIGTGLKEPGTFGSTQMRLIYLLFGLLLATDRARRAQEREA